MIDGVERREGVPKVLDGGHALEADGVGDLIDGTLADDQDVLRVELSQHPHRRVSHHHLCENSV